MKESYILVLGYTLKDARKYCALTQSQVVKDLIKSGRYCTRQSLVMWENGQAMPNKPMREALDNYYKKHIKIMEGMLGW